jgi:hypothetical protein
MGQHLEHHEGILLNEVRLHEKLPLEETKMLAVSLDGVNIQLNMPDKKKGCPPERPKDDDAMSCKTSSCFKNTMVGVCSLYGEVPENTDETTSTPKRIYGN